MKHQLEIRHRSFYADEDEDFCMHCLLEDATDALTKAEFYINDYVMCGQIITIWATGDKSVLEKTFPWETYDNLIFLYPTELFEITYEIKQ